MVDFAEIPDLAPLICPRCGRYLVAVPYENKRGKHVFLYCNNWRCRHADILEPDSADYAKIYKIGKRRIQRLQNQKRRYGKREKTW